MKQQSAKKNTFLNSIQVIAMVFVPLLTFPYTSRVFGTEGVGQFNFASSVITIFQLLANLGSYTYCVREGTKVRNDREKLNKFASEIISLNAISTIIVCLTLLLLTLGIKQFYSVKNLIFLLGISVPFYGLDIGWLYGIYENYTYISIRQICVQLSTVILLYGFIHSINDLPLWCLIIAMTSSVPIVINYLKSTKYVSISIKKRKQLNVKQHIKPILTLFFIQIASKIYNNLDTLLLGFLATNYNIGIYSVAVKINTVLLTGYTVMMPVYLPRLVELRARNDKYGYINFFDKIFKVVYFISVPCVIGMELMSEEIVMFLAGTGFADSIITLRILAPIVFLNSLSTFLYNCVLVPCGKEDQVLKCNLAASLINLVLSTILIPFFVENGAALGSVAAELSGLLLAMYYSKKSGYYVGFKFKSVIKYSIADLLIVASCIVSRVFFSAWFIRLVVAIALSAVTYIGALLISKDQLAVDFLAMVKRKLKRD